MATPTHIEEHISLSREEVVALLRGKTLKWKARPNTGSTLFTAAMSFTVNGEMSSAERSKAVDALTRSPKASYMDGWIHRPDGTALPVPGSTAWMVFIVTNADRILVTDSNGVNFPLRDLPPERQTEVIEGWLVNGVTPVPVVGAHEVLARVEAFDAERARIEAPTPDEPRLTARLDDGDIDDYQDNVDAATMRFR